MLMSADIEELWQHRQSRRKILGFVMDLKAFPIAYEYFILVFLAVVGLLWMGVLRKERPRSTVRRSLDNDAISEIVLRLNPKSVATFKLASKHWFRVLSDPQFVQRYYQRRPSNGGMTGFFYQASKKYPEKLQYVPVCPSRQYITDPPSCLGFLEHPAILINSCNGLLHWICSDGQHFISNPLLDKGLRISRAFWLKRSFLASGLAFDSSQSNHFRLVVLVRHKVEGNNKLRSLTFSSKTMHWSSGADKNNLQPNIRGAKPFCPYRGFFLNNFLFWEFRDLSLLAYNVFDESSYLIELPVRCEELKPWDLELPGCLGSWGGSLEYCRIIGSRLSVWVASGNLFNSTGFLSLSNKRKKALDWVSKLNIDLLGVSVGINLNGAHALAIFNDCEGVLLAVEGGVVIYWVFGGKIDQVCEVRPNGEPPNYIHPSKFFPFLHSSALQNFPDRLSPSNAP